MSTPFSNGKEPSYKGVVDKMVVVSLKMPSSLRTALNVAAAKKDESESHFIRMAVAERLQKLEEKIPADALRRPSRKGVGGRPTHKKNPVQDRGSPTPGGPFSFQPAPPLPDPKDSSATGNSDMLDAQHALCAEVLGGVQTVETKAVSVRAIGERRRPVRGKGN